MIKNNSFHIIFLWFITVLISLIWNLNIIQSNNNDLVEEQARTLFKQIELTRSWNSLHGGVYVPITEYTAPNKYLKDTLRDLTSTEGIALTMVNPAYMTRQISELNQSKFDIQFHITSLDPIRPKNKADEWETAALKEFENYIPEKLELIENENFPQYRYMAPLITEQSCLKCHDNQGLEVGDIRGGISISIPANVFLDTQKEAILYSLAIHMLVFFLGATGLLYFFKSQKRFEKALQEKNDELELKESELLLKNQNLSELNSKKDKFFSIIAHDLKNPFKNIIGFSEMLGDKDTPATQESKDKLAENIYNTAQNTYTLLENLLDWAHTELDSISFKLKTFNLSNLIEENLFFVNEMAQEKGVIIENLIPRKNDITADKNMLHTILRNLFSNAVKFSNAGGRIEIYEDIEENYHHIIVQDHGVGMTKDQMNCLFKIDIDQSCVGLHNNTGTGLGLILCKEFMNKHKGNIAVESSLNKGSKFTVSFPRNN